MTVGAVIIGPDGRAKAYRPLPDADRAAALRAGLAAFGRGDFFEAHELLEPAWMGTNVPAERALLQGLIKVAAAYVHAARGNPVGISRNLQGARLRLVEAQEGYRTAGLSDPTWLDIEALVGAIDVRLADLATHAGGPTLGPPELPGSVP